MNHISEDIKHSCTKQVGRIAYSDKLWACIRASFLNGNLLYFYIDLAALEASTQDFPYISLQFSQYW